MKFIHAKLNGQMTERTARSFERSFELADYVKVKGASLENGLPTRRPRARDSGGDEASGDPNHELQQASGGQSDQGRGLML